jgi:hypothetical protein
MRKAVRWGEEHRRGARLSGPLLCFTLVFFSRRWQHKASGVKRPIRRQAENPILGLGKAVRPDGGTERSGC